MLARKASKFQSLPSGERQTAQEGVTSVEVKENEVRLSEGAHLRLGLEEGTEGLEGCTAVPR